MRYTGSWLIVMKKYDSLDGIRAYAAILILAMHVFENSKYNEISNVVSIRIDLLKWLVYLFMILSGFSLCCGYYEKFKNQEISIEGFYKKILPFFTVMVIMDCLTDFSFNSVIEGIADVTLVFALLPNANISVLGVGWFLGVVFLIQTMLWKDFKNILIFCFALCTFA